jgi:Tol biopolymer transport system component
MTTPERLRILPALGAALATLTVALALAGCGGNPTKATGPRGDVTGEHLVVYTSDAGRTAGDHGIVLFDFDLAAFHALPGIDAPGSEFDPCLSNDGGFIAFSAARSTSRTDSDVFLYDRLNQGLIATPNLNTAADETWPRFTYDSVHLAFVRRLPSGQRRVRLYEPLGDSLIALPGLADTTITGDNDDEPAPNLDGTRIAFMSDRRGAHDIWLWTRGTNAATVPLLASGGDDIEPALSADGRWLAFASDRSGGAGGYDVYLYDVTTNTLVPLPGLNGAGNDRHPSVSADGDVIVFQSDRAGGGGQNDIYRYVVSAATVSQPAQLQTSSDDVSPYVRWR